jgi:pimeloyl-ACP methyl ester carboxylesterase
MIALMPAKTVNGQTLHYEIAGEGQPVVLLHGFPLDSRIWTKQREALAAKHHVITPDLRGFGRSASLSKFTLGELAEDVHALLVELKALPCVLGGLSMGGYVALEYVRKFPADLEGLMLIDTKAEGDTPEGKAGRDKMIQLVREKGSPAVAEAMMPKMLAADSEKNRPAVARELRGIMEKCPALTIEHALAAMRDRADHSGNLASIAVPTLIIVGEADAITPPAMAEAMNKAIPRSQMVMIKGAGHLTSMEQPEQTARAIADFLQHC